MIVRNSGKLQRRTLNPNLPIFTSKFHLFFIVLLSDDVILRRQERALQIDYNLQIFELRINIIKTNQWFVFAD